MNENKFKRLMAAAKTTSDDYSSGYVRGLRRHYHGEQFGTEAEHNQWMALSHHRQEIGDGYRDGFAGKPPRGAHGNLGNINAQGDLPADATIQCRVNAWRKSGYVKSAQQEGLNLSEWILKHLDAAAQKHEN